MSIPHAALGLLACALILPDSASAEVCRSVNEHGVVSFSSDCGQGRRAPAGYMYQYQRPDNVIVLTNIPDKSLPLISKRAYFAPKGWADAPASSTRWTLNREAFDELIRSTALQQGVDPALVRAVVHAESGFNPRALSPKGATGLMQLMPATASRFGVSNIYDPVENVRGGVTYLRFLLNMFNQDARLAVAAYNAGENAVLKYGGIPPYEETVTYVGRVLDLHGRYRAEQ
ncbi:MAG: lytic transglycosylase domain-containing protein [Pseudomonadota bacterium]